MKCSIAASLALLLQVTNLTAEVEYDIVIYGGTSAGLVAGFQALEMGKSVIVIEPTQRIGGLTTGGLGQTDIGNKQVIDGLSREFYRRVAAHYAKEGSWNWQERSDYRSGGQSKTAAGEDTMWTFEPSAALQIFEDWIEETGLEIAFGQRLDREQGVTKDGAEILSITMETGETYRGKVFLDTTYEGDLFAASGVSYTVGRESNSLYGETLNGVQTRNAKSHNFVHGVDPWKTPGDPESGPLPFIDLDGPGEEGEGDHRVQAYCFRMCLTDHPENRIPFAKPADYEEICYELLFRDFEAGADRIPWINSAMPNRKTDTNNRNGYSTDFIGQNYDYSEASYEERAAIVARHRLYQQGLMWTLANHPRIPERVRSEVSRWGTCRDDFAREDGWQEQLYIREARRMIGELVMTQNHCQHRESIPDSIGMGAYTMDSHNTQRYINQAGHARNEGDVQVGGFPPYPISYRAICPKREEAVNLLIPVSLSASHIAFGSIRMEPVFMVLAESAATAASQAIDQEIAVQDLEYGPLREALEGQDQILYHGIVEGLVLDEEDATLTGHWKRGELRSGYRGDYLHDSGAGDGESSATFRYPLPQPGRYEVWIAYAPNPNRATNAPVVITHSAGTATVTVNQQEPIRDNSGFLSLGEWEFGEAATLKVSNTDTDGHVIVDAVHLALKED
ncbi:MAG: FAD-dependent oxidoreductase [Verrucomicrobiota bacterium]